MLHTMSPSPIPKPRSIRAHLVTLVAAVAIPLVGLQIWSGLSAYRSRLAEGEQAVRYRAEAVAAGLDGFFGTAESLMRGVAVEVEEELSAGRCPELLPALARALDMLSNVLAVDAQGRILCSTNPLPNGLASVRDWSWFQALKGGETFAVSEPVRGSISRTPVVAVAVPIHGRTGAMVGALAGSIPLRRLESLMNETSALPGERVELTTAAGTPVVAVGSVMDEDAVRGAAVASSGWRVHVGIPSWEVYPLARAEVVRRALFGGLVVGLTLFLSWLLYGRIAAGLALLGDATEEALRGSSVPAVPAFAPREVLEVLERVRRIQRERAAAEEAERRARARYRSIFDNAVFGLYVSTPDGRFTSVNPALVHMLRYPSEEALIAAGPTALYRDPDERARLIERYHDTGIFSNVETQWVRADGEVITVRLNGKVIDIDGEEAAFEVIVEDVTDEKRLEEERRQAQKMEAMGRLAGGIAHDFNNVLTVISGTLELLDAELSPDDPIRADLDQMAHATERATTLTRQLLSFSRREAGPARPVDLNQVVRNLQSMLTRLIGEDVRLDTNLDEGPLVVMGDPSRLEQVIMNLVINARDAITGNGHIVIGTSLVQGRGGDGPLSRRYGSGVLLVVRDNGCGMDEHTRARVFEPFFTTKGEERGTGLGLSTAYSIITSMGGHIAVDSAPGVGTEFQIWLPHPAAEDVAGAAPQGPVRPREALRDEHGGAELILVAEDEDLVRHMVRRILEKEGYRVITATDGEEAIRLFDAQEGAVSLVLTDVVMPNMKGSELAARVTMRAPSVPVLFMSGYADDLLQRQDGIQVSPELFISKPFDPGELCMRVRQVLDGRLAASLDR